MQFILLDYRNFFVICLVCSWFICYIACKIFQTTLAEKKTFGHGGMVSGKKKAYFALFHFVDENFFLFKSCELYIINHFICINNLHCVAIQEFSAAPRFLDFFYSSSNFGRISNYLSSGSIVWMLLWMHIGCNWNYMKFLWSNSIVMKYWWL